jgi:hypothetical protein
MSAIAQQAQVAKTVAVSTGKVANAKSMMVWRPHGNKYVRDRERRRLAFFSSSRGHRRVAPDLDRVREPSEGSAPSSAVRVRATRRDRARCVGLFSFASAIAREARRDARGEASIDRSIVSPCAVRAGFKPSFAIEPDPRLSFVRKGSGCFHESSLVKLRITPYMGFPSATDNRDWSAH